MADVVWSTESYTPKQILEFHSKSDYPLVAKLTPGPGLCGKNNNAETAVETFVQDKVFYITGTSSQKKVVATDKNGRLLSIALSYPLHFEKKSSRSFGFSKPKSLQEIVNSSSLPVVVRFDQQFAKDFYVTTSKTAEHFGNMTITRVYEEKHLQCSVFRPDGEGHSLIIPDYMRMYIALGVGLVNGIKKEWDAIRQNAAALTKSSQKRTPSKKTTGTSLGLDIMMIEKPKQKLDNIYENFEDETYCFVQNEHTKSCMEEKKKDDDKVKSVKSSNIYSTHSTMKTPSKSDSSYPSGMPTSDHHNVRGMTMPSTSGHHGMTLGSTAGHVHNSGMISQSTSGHHHGGITASSRSISRQHGVPHHGGMTAPSLSAHQHRGMTSPGHHGGMTTPSRSPSGHHGTMTPSSRGTSSRQGHTTHSTHPRSRRRSSSTSSRDSSIKGYLCRCVCYI